MTFSLSRQIPALQLEVIYQRGASFQDHKKQTWWTQALTPTHTHQHPTTHTPHTHTHTHTPTHTLTPHPPHHHPTHTLPYGMCPVAWETGNAACVPSTQTRTQTHTHTHARTHTRTHAHTHTHTRTQRKRPGIILGG